MDRRGFLHGMLALGAAPAIVRIGSLMPVRSIAIPTTAEVIAVGGNQLLTIDMITREALRILNSNLSFIITINKPYDLALSKNSGDRIVIRRPIAYG